MSVEEFKAKVIKLNLLKQNGMITEEQFEEIKKKLLKDMMEGARV